MQSMPFFQGGGMPWAWMGGRDPRGASQGIGPSPGGVAQHVPMPPSPGMPQNNGMNGGMNGGMGGMGQGMPPPPMGPLPSANDEDVARLKRELDELRAGIKGRKRGPRRKTPPSAE